MDEMLNGSGPGEEEEEDFQESFERRLYRISEELDSLAGDVAEAFAKDELVNEGYGDEEDEEEGEEEYDDEYE